MERIIQIGIGLLCGSLFLIAAMFLAVMGAVDLAIASIVMVGAFSLSLFQVRASIILLAGITGIVLIFMGVLT